MLLSLINKLLGDPNKKNLKDIYPLVDQINSLENTIKSLNDSALKEKTLEFKKRLKENEVLENLLPEAFAVVREASRRVLGERHYDVQLIGGIVLHQGKISEMKTGEGKTLVATLPVYLNALSEKGVHIITVNDYLAKRDALWMGQIYEFLGLTVKYVIHGLSNEERKAAYNADITYGTNNEFGFDYLRDNMAVTPEELVQRELNYAIVDEVDSILIDEARTPLIISAPNEESTNKYVKYASLIPQLQKNVDYEVDEKLKSTILTEIGIAKMEKLLGVENIYSEVGYAEVHHIEQALKAQTIFQKDRDYIVKDDEVIIVDEFTGRLMPGRRFSEGLHQAIEAKERVTVKRESKTMATITFQNYFRLYKKLAGMTGTAYTEAEEFRQIYGLDVVIIPTNRNISRIDRPDAIFKNEKGKFKAITDEIEKIHKTGQPILVGTISIEKSEEISKILSKKRIPHQVLNAKHHEKEAEIIAKAGQFGAVTIATNMAGRGTDIKLADESREKEGLYIIGTERHEARRIDNQLRGRAGRQGDPGVTQFFISMEDSLPRLFGSDRIKNMMETLGIPDDLPIENKMVSSAIENAQKRVEGHNFDIRKHVLQYDDVLNKQRKTVYTRRNKLLHSTDIHNDILELIKAEAKKIVETNIDPENGYPNKTLILRVIKQAIGREQELLAKSLEDLTFEIETIFIDHYNQKEIEANNSEFFHLIERHVYLRAIDNLWMEHIDEMSHLRDEVSLQGYGQRDPLQIYQQEAYHMFVNLLSQIQTNTIMTLFRLNFEINPNIRLKKQSNLRTNENELQDGSNASSFVPEKKVTKTIQNEQKINRNDPCPCGSGKKYKKCCGRN